MILITGSDGFIGKHLCKRLESDGYKFIKIDLKSGNDINDDNIYEDIVTVYHLAAQTSVQKSIDAPREDAITNIGTILSVINKYPNAKIIYPGSAASISCNSPYGLSKKVAGEYIKLLHENHAICNLPNIYGQGSNGVVDVYKNSHEVIIYGDGTQVRTFLNVDDVVDALVMSINWKGEYNLGGEVLSILELAKKTNKTISFKESLPGEVYLSKIESNRLDWSPKVNLSDYLNS